MQGFGRGFGQALDPGILEHRTEQFLAPLDKDLAGDGFGRGFRCGLESRSDLRTIDAGTLSARFAIALAEHARREVGDERSRIAHD